ncbi:MAG: glycosyltransferase [Oscillospiraceae bacterium]|jgi:glycosyltransferase involved in cell wall biosynthesis|nr:glycosyltransferase [Oscillospiraceae bacterium]
MKARIIGNNSGIVLSVGMIVKNEEKYLAQCLDALKPLLDAVPSELVITDTGSTDKTVEIARRYTDKVFHFDWIGDFSAARNFGLNKCVGEWFMFIDADDILDEDLSEITAFFTDGKMLNKYRSAVYMTKDYTTPDGSVWSKFAVHRIAKRVPGLCFKGAIHEHLSPFPAPTRYLSTFANHWGYAHETAEQKEAKKQRNLVPLYEELKKNPDDCRVRFHINKELSGEEAETFLRESLVVARKQPKDDYAACFLVLNIQICCEREEYDKAKACINEFLGIYKRQAKSKSVLWLDVYAAKALTLQKQGEYEEAIKSFEDYFRLYEAYMRGNLSAVGLGMMSITFIEPEKHDAAKAEYNSLLFKTGRKKVAFDTSIVNAEIQVVSKGGADDVPDDNAAQDSVSEQDYETVLNTLKNNADITDTILNMNDEYLTAILAKIAQNNLNMPRLVMGYKDERFFTESPENLSFGIKLYEAALGYTGRIPWHERAVFYGSFAKYAARYAADNRNSGELSEIHRFGFYAGAARKALDSGNRQGYIDEFKKVSDSCRSEHIRYAAEFLLEDFTGG